jgi:uncharacterized membrane protein YgcG
VPAPATIFEPGKTHCPGCHAPLTTLVDACPHCGFTAAACLARFPFEPPPLTRYIDPEQVLTAKMRKQADRAIKRLERRFPQVTVHTCLLSLAEGVDTREFGYWLFNRSVPQGSLEEQHRPYSLLLIIDRRSRTASLTVGYGLDPFFDDYVLEKSMDEGAALMADDEYGLGIARIIDDLMTAFMRVHTRARYAFEKWQRHGHSRSEPRSSPSQPPPELPTATIPVSRILSPVATTAPSERSHAHAPTAP